MAPKKAEFKPEIKEFDFKGYPMRVDTAVLDDVKLLDMIDAIENDHRLKQIIPFMEFLVGKEEYEKIEAYFVEKDGRFKLTTLTELYYAIFENFNPKS